MKKNYLGNKGYTLYKDDLSSQEIKMIKKDLFMKPFIPGKGFNKNDSQGFNIYRENEKKNICSKILWSRKIWRSK